MFQKLKHLGAGRVTLLARMPFYGLSRTWNFFWIRKSSSTSTDITSTHLDSYCEHLISTVTICGSTWCSRLLLIPTTSRYPGWRIISNHYICGTYSVLESHLASWTLYASAVPTTPCSAEERALTKFSHLATAESWQSRGTQTGPQEAWLPMRHWHS